MPKQPDFDMSLKILLIGNSGVGKSCVLMRFSENKFSNTFYNTIGVDFVQNSLKIESKVPGCKWTKSETGIGNFGVTQWDTAGQQRFRTITNSYYRGAHGIVIVYDITDRDSFDNVRMWYEQMNKNINQKVICMLVGNKLDMSSRRTVSFEEGRSLANKYGIPFAQTSAKTSQNINQIFNELSERMMQNNQGKKQKKLKPPMPLHASQSTSQVCTCCGN